MTDFEEKFENNKNIALMFPGQGSQYIGMGMELVQKSKTVKTFFEKASEKLSFNLQKIISGSGTDGSDLSQTFFSQISIFVLSMALKTYVFRDLENIKHNILCNIGHSLGDYSALTASGFFNFENGLEVVGKRAKLMENINDQTEGMMAAVLGLTGEEVEQSIKKSRGRVYIANINDYKQIVISGFKKDVEKFIRFLKESSNAKIIPLKVRIASHCPIMQAVSDSLFNYLTKYSSGSLEIDFYSSSEKKFCSEKEIVKALASQLVRPVNWLESIENLLDLGAEIFIETGPGKVLSNLVKRIAQKNNKAIHVFDTDNLKSIDNLKKFLNERIK